MRQGFALAMLAVFGVQFGDGQARAQAFADRPFAADVAAGIKLAQSQKEERIIMPDAGPTCIRLGGAVEVYYQQGRWPYQVCSFDGGRIGLYTLYGVVRSKAQTQATNFFLFHQVKMPEYDGSYSPDHRYCSLAGGEPVSIGNKKGDVLFAMCKFPDWSVIEAWTLLRGPKIEKKLAEVLKTQ